MLPDLRDLYIHKSRLLHELEKVEEQISFLECPENITDDRMEMLKKQAIKHHYLPDFKKIVAFFTF
jgi:hypothetical protein